MITISNPKIVDFYSTHPQFNIDEMNLIFIDFINKLFLHIPSKENEQSIMLDLLQTINSKCSAMESQQKNIDDHLKDMRQQIIDSISLQIYSTKDSYINELDKFIQSGKSAKIKEQQQLANDNLDKIMDKIHIFFGDKFMSDFNDRIQQFNQNIHQEFKEAVRSDPTADLLSKFEASINEKYDKLRLDIEKFDYKKDISVIKNHFERQKNSSFKGADGETKLETILNSIFPSDTIVNTTGKSKSGDFIIEREDMANIMFENKDYTNNVPIGEVDKFIRDIDHLNMHGIFLSQSSGISRKDDFHIDIHNNNVIIFVHNVNYSIDKVRIAVSMLDHLVYTLDKMGKQGDMIAEEVMIDINKEFQYFLQQRQNLIELVRKFNKDATKQISDMNLPELTVLLANKFASTDTNPFKCPQCNKIYKNAKSLAAHAKRCSP